MSEKHDPKEHSLFKPIEVAAILGFSRRRVCNKMRDGVFPSVTVANEPLSARNRKRGRIPRKFLVEYLIKLNPEKDREEIEQLIPERSRYDEIVKHVKENVAP